MMARGWTPPANRRNQYTKYQERLRNADLAARRRSNHDMLMELLKKAETAVDFAPKTRVLQIKPDDILSVGNRVAILPRTLYEKERYATITQTDVINRGLTQKLWMKLDGSQRELVYYYPGEVRKLEHRIIPFSATQEQAA